MIYWRYTIWATPQLCLRILNNVRETMKDTKQKWFKEAKYGLFIHFGLYSILEGEYKGKITPTIAEWIMNTLDIPVEEYEKLAKEFNPVNFDPKDYVAKAKKWGMKYICITSKHHDGFALYQSKSCAYNIVDSSPYAKDIIKGLADECKKQGLIFCVYYSQAQDWHHPDGYMADKDNSKKNFRRYLDEKCIPQIRELLTEYGDIGMIWFDTPLDMTGEESKELFDLVKSLQPNCIVSGRIGNNLGEYMTTGDNFIPTLPYPGDWEVPATLNDTWGFKRSDGNWKNPEHVLKLLIKIVSRGGNYLLNVGPDKFGVIPSESIDILDRIGEFLEKNGDSIYGTKAVPLPTYEVEGLAYTCKPGKMYIHILTPQPFIEILNIENKIKKAYYLDTGEEIRHVVRRTCEGDGLWRFFIEKDIKNALATVICVEMEEEDIVFSPIEEISH